MVLMKFTVFSWCLYDLVSSLCVVFPLIICWYPAPVLFAAGVIQVSMRRLSPAKDLKNLIPEGTKPAALDFLRHMLARLLEMGQDSLYCSTFQPTRTPMFEPNPSPITFQTQLNFS